MLGGAHEYDVEYVGNIHFSPTDELVTVKQAKSSAQGEVGLFEAVSGAPGFSRLCDVVNFVELQCATSSLDRNHSFPYLRRDLLDLSAPPSRSLNLSVRTKMQHLFDL